MSPRTPEHDTNHAERGPSQPMTRILTDKGTLKALGAVAGKDTKPFASHQEALAYLNDRPNMERTRQRRAFADELKLERMHALCKALGSPERSFRSVHVAGSKGKGSTAGMLASALGGCGYVAGLFTSPHLVSVRERIRINGTEIAPEAFDEHLAECRRAAEQIESKHGATTYFELVTALAFLHFADQAVDLMVAEVGLGGRLDSTNVILPEVCLLTRIHLEHTDILGDTLAKIAAEKAGIMKPGVPAVSVPQEPEVIEVFRAHAERVGCSLRILGTDMEFSTRFESDPTRGPHCKVNVVLDEHRFEHLPVPLLGHHQAENASLAVAAIHHLNRVGFVCSERGVAEGLERTERFGRLEQVWNQPRVFVDGAHTPESIEAMIRAVGTHIPADSIVIVFGCPSDKDVDGMLGALGVGADKVVFTRAADSPRAMPPAELALKFAERTESSPQHADTVREAINLAAKAIGPDDLILVCGSFLVAGEAKRLFQEKLTVRT